MPELGFYCRLPRRNRADFDATLKLARTWLLISSFVFIYSPRPGTPAANLPDDIAHSEGAPAGGAERG